jgi:monoterpene epsilon-lactone hydrolase
MGATEGEAAEIPQGGPRPSRQSRAISRALRLGVRPLANQVRGNSLSIRTVRRTIDAAARLMKVDPRVEVEPLAEPRGEWVRPRENRSDDGAILYLHGGAYLLCSAQTHRPITGRLALDTRLPVLALNYRLAPEHRFPAALDDAVAAYNWLLTQGLAPGRIVIAGDSAGGHLAASLVAELCRLGRPGPAGVVLYSPWVDLACELSSEWDRWIADPYISPAAARRLGRLVLAGCDLEDPRVALLKCAWTGTIPPFLIQVGGAEVLRPEAERFAALLRSAGVDCELQVWPGQMHVFQMLHRIIPESRAAMLDTARFVGTAIAAAAAEAA